mmetsp:Transcript_1891/g.5974  ORF Transcript_1891/g.5974 Transcript_1891/m.5974 type:complete len:134 (+) Transcript_1891:68-469(+)
MVRARSLPPLRQAVLTARQFETRLPHESPVEALHLSSGWQVSEAYRQREAEPGLHMPVEQDDFLRRVESRRLSVRTGRARSATPQAPAISARQGVPPLLQRGEICMPGWPVFVQLLGLHAPARRKQVKKKKIK